MVSYCCWANTVTPEQANAIIAMGAALAGIFGAFTVDYK